MKVTKKSESELFVSNNTGIIVWLIGAIIGGVGGVAFYYQYQTGFLDGGNSAMAIIFPIFGLAIIFIGSVTRITISKMFGIVYKTIRVIGVKTSQYPLSDVARVEIRRVLQAGSKGGLALNISSVIVLKNGQELYITHGGSFEELVARRSYVDAGRNQAVAAKEIAVFIGVPFQEVGITESQLPGIK